jgi:hypothetical protein
MTRQYVIIEPSDPESFKTRVYEALLHRKNIVVTAQPVLDELATRRGDSATAEQFEFSPGYLGINPSDFSLDVQDVRHDRWIHITVDEDDVRFNVHGEV